MAAKTIIQEYDFSSFVPKMSGIYAGIVVTSVKGDIDKVRFIPDAETYLKKYGDPSPTRGVSEYSALTYLTFGGPMFIVRAAHNTNLGKLPGKDPKYPAALVRGKVTPIPPSNVIPDPDYEPQRVVEPLKDGLTQHELDAYNFPLYKTHRQYEFEDVGIMQSVLNDNEVKVFSFEDLKVGDEVSFTPVVYVAESASKGDKTIKLNDVSYCNPDQKIEILGQEIQIQDVDYDNNTITLDFPLEMNLAVNFPIHIVPFDLSANYEIEALEIKQVDYDVLTLNNKITADKAEPIRLVIITPTHFSDLDSSYVDIKLSADANNVATISVNSTNGVDVKQTHKIGNVEYVVKSFDANAGTITYETAVTASNGDEVILMKRDYKEFEDPVYVVRAIKESTQVIVTNADYIKNNETIAFGVGLTTAEDEAKVTSKDLYKEDQKWMVLDKNIVLYPNFRCYKMTHSEYEDRDAFLVYSINQGKWGNEIEVGITKSKLKDAFYVEVYNNGVPTGEKFHCSMKYMKDGYGNQLFIESVINGKSNYISVKVNPAFIDEKGNPIPPLLTDYSLWRKDPVDVFLPIKLSNGKVNVTEEDVLLNDVEIAVTDNTVFKLGQRIRFEGFEGEYKILDVTSDIAGNPVIKLDRRVIVDKIPMGTTILRYAYTKYFPIVKLDKALPGYVTPCDYTLAGESGVLLDAGVNNLKGGNNGSQPTIGDLMRAAELFKNDSIKFQLLLDGGFAFPAYQQKLVEVAEHKLTCFAYLSVDVNAEKSVNYIEDIINYRNSTMLNTSWAGIFTPHVKIYDQYNQLEIWVSPESFAASKQAFVEREAVMWQPAAGWTYGKILVLDVVRRFSQPEIDLLTDEHQINCLKYEDGDGIAIWGNETMLTMPSYLQARHIRMFLIVLETGLKDYLKYQSFNLNDAEHRGIIVYNINKFFKEVLASGVYNFVVEDVTNDSNINNREAVFRMIFAPKMDMEKLIAQVVITSKGMDFGLINAAMG